MRRLCWVMTLTWALTMTLAVWRLWLQPTQVIKLAVVDARPPITVIRYGLPSLKVGRQTLQAVHQSHR